MRIGMISDLHVDTNKTALKENLLFSSLVADMIKEKGIDLLLLAGDNSSNAFLSQKVIDEIKEKSQADLLFVPGNHDLWSRKNGVSNTRELYDFFTSQPENLVGNPRILSEKWAIAGTGGWYDYGYGNHEKYTMEEFSKKQYRFASWNDKQFINWGESDREVSKKMLDQLEKDLLSVGDRHIILMTHVATHPEFVVPLPNKIYDYFNAFLGSSSYESLYTRFSIKYSLMGHVHLRKVVKQDDATFISACLGSKKHWTTKDAREELERTMITIDLSL